jgi:hypothetical protein
MLLYSKISPNVCTSTRSDTVARPKECREATMSPSRHPNLKGAGKDETCMDIYLLLYIIGGELCDCDPTRNNVNAQKCRNACFRRFGKETAHGEFVPLLRKETRDLAVRSQEHTYRPNVYRCRGPTFVLHHHLVLSRRPHPHTAGFCTPCTPVSEEPAPIQPTLSHMMIFQTLAPTKIQRPQCLLVW